MSFRFRQFYINDERCAMKVGTDGVLLGAWAGRFQENQPLRILDIGTGSGLIALMLAERFPNAIITAIDIDNEAVEQALENFANSPWSNRLSAHSISLQEFSRIHLDASYSHSALYDLIVCNPPFFANSLRNPNPQRALARHTDSLPYESLLSDAASLLAREGTLALIYPAETMTQVIEQAMRYNLYPMRLSHIFSKKGKPERRTLCEFSHNKSACFDEQTLYLEDDSSNRSEQYKTLTDEFYL